MHLFRIVIPRTAAYATVVASKVSTCAEDFQASAKANKTTATIAVTSVFTLDGWIAVMSMGTMTDRPPRIAAMNRFFMPWSRSSRPSRWLLLKIASVAVRSGLSSDVLSSDVCSPDLCVPCSRVFSLSPRCLIDEAETCRSSSDPGFGALDDVSAPLEIPFNSDRRTTSSSLSRLFRNAWPAFVKCSLLQMSEDLRLKTTSVLLGLKHTHHTLSSCYLCALSARWMSFFAPKSFESHTATVLSNAPSPAHVRFENSALCLLRSRYLEASELRPHCWMYKETRITWTYG